MGDQKRQGTSDQAWALVRQQHGVITRSQLLDLGFSAKAIKHRIETGRLHPVWRGVYAVGRRQLTQRGIWMAAVLTCGDGAALSHGCAGALQAIRPVVRGPIHVSVPGRSHRHPSGIVVHRRPWLRQEHVVERHGIPVICPVFTLIDLATFLEPDQLERAVNDADKRDLIKVDALRAALDELPPRQGTAALRELLDRPTFTLTDSELERLMLPIAQRAGLTKPLTQQYVNGFRVDFYWPDLGLIVETDGLRYHRTPFEQERDHERDQAHAAAGLTTLRFTHSQVAHRPAYVEERLRDVARRLISHPAGAAR